MISWKRFAAAAAIVLAPLGTTGIAVGLTAAPAGALPSCGGTTDNWVGPTGVTTNWSANAAYWTQGFPTSTSNVCINESDTYSVDLTASVSINSLQVGGGATGTQTLIVDGSGTNVELTLASGTTSEVAGNGDLSLAPSSSGFAMLTGSSGITVASGGTLDTTGSSNIAYLRTPITNDSGGAVTIGAATTNQDSTTLTSNSGTFSVSSGGGYNLTGNSTFTDAAGTLTLTGTGSMTQDDGTFTQSGGTESGNAVTVDGGATLVDSAGAGAFNVIGSSSLSGTIPAGQSVNVNGSSTNVELTVNAAVTVDGTLDLSPTSAGFAMVTGTGSLTVTSGANLATIAGSTNEAYLRVPITNDVGGTVTIGAPTTDQDSNTLTTSSGTFTVSSGAGYLLTGSSSFTHSAGTLTVTGSMTQDDGTFTQTSGDIAGNPVTVDGGATIADSAGTGGFDVIGSSSLSGTVPVGQTVNVDGSGTNVQLSVNAGVAVKGTLDLSPASAGYAMVTGTGHLTVKSGGNLATVGSSNIAYLRTAISNKTGGTVTIGAATTNQDSNTLTKNSGTFTVSSGGGYTLSGGSSFKDSAGTLTVTGSMTENGGTFTQSGGTESGNPVQIDSAATLADSAGAGAFDVVGSSSLTGTIPAGQSVNINGSGTNVDLDVAAAVTIDGTLDLSPASAGYAMVSGGGTLTVASGGNLATVGPSTNEAYLRTPVTNESGGTVTIGAPTTRQDSDTVTDNSGTLQVINGGQLALSAGSTLTNTSTATVGVTVNGTAGTGGISGSGETDAGTLAVSTVGTPTTGTVFTPISGPGATGTFSEFNFETDSYTVTYPSGTVQVTAEQTFTLTPTSFSPKEEYHQTGAVQVATINDANLGTGTYSATVNWGDGKPTVAATVNVSGSSGTVTAPTHKYKAAGVFTVTITVANTVGSTVTYVTTTEPVTITGPTFTSVSPTTGPVGTHVTIVGTDLAGATVDFAVGHPATIISDTATQIVAKVPSGAVTGKITVVVADGKSKTPIFTVT
jgi:hypothetical protein